MGGSTTVRDLDRRRRLATTLELLGETEVGRELGLARLTSFDDFRASLPLLDFEAHAQRVTARLGFGRDGLDDETLTAATVDRSVLAATWRERLAGGRPRRIAILQAPADDALIDRMRVDDLRAIVDEHSKPTLLRLEQLSGDGEALLDELHRFRPDALVTPSLATVAWFEQISRAPLERSLPQLRWLFAEHDLDERIRTRLPVINSGWVHAAGRIALPAHRGPHDALMLAVRSTLIELLPHGDPEMDYPARPRSGGEMDYPVRDPQSGGGMDYPVRDSRSGAGMDPRSHAGERTVLPEHATLGENYELVLSSPLGFLRLRSGLHVRVVGFAPRSNSELISDSLPRPRVLRLPPPPADALLEGVTVPGAWLTASVRQAFLPEDPALVAAEITADPDAVDVSARASRTGLDPFSETELGASRAAAVRGGPKPRSLVVRLEVQGQSTPNFPIQVSTRIDTDLRRRSAAYDWLRARDELWEPRVVIARPGTARRSRERRIRNLSGSVARPVVQMT